MMGRIHVQHDELSFSIYNGSGVWDWAGGRKLLPSAILPEITHVRTAPSPPKRCTKDYKAEERSCIILWPLTPKIDRAKWAFLKFDM